MYHLFLQYPLVISYYILINYVVHSKLKLEFSIIRIPMYFYIHCQN